MVNSSGIFVKGKLYWTSVASVHELNDYSRCNIICFDLANETWGMVEQPNYREEKFSLMPGIFGSDLVVTCNHEGSHSDVWVMNDYGVEAFWTKMFTINCPDDPGNYVHYRPFAMSFSPPICQSNKGEILLLYRSTFMINNPKDDSIRQPEVTKFESCFEAEIYVESLVSPSLVADWGHDNHED
ncbi:F-box/kelch-repeat protein At3g23880-like [Nicotiana tabacum]|uniref:F-box/kelch-repeat protein At3g23880-like n=1 Tax=Nicotiana tabacum TaxID=4097 RepID=A0A1S3ZAA2_TOBAC